MSERTRNRVMWSTVAFLVVVILVFFVRRLLTDVPNLGEGSSVNGFDGRYADHPVIAYLHILPGLVFLLAAIGQLSARYRGANLARHRRNGRILVPVGIVTGAFAIVFGTLYPWGGFLERSATVVFGLYFMACLVLGFRAIRGREVVKHRRWMIRAFAVALGVSLIRAWLGVLLLAGLGFQSAFGVAFWLGLGMAAIAAELYLRVRPVPGPAAATAG